MFETSWNFAVKQLCGKSDMLCQEQRRTDLKCGGVVPVTFDFKVNLALILKKMKKRSSERKFVVVLMFVWKPPSLP